MKMFISTCKRQAQDFVLRLFVDPVGDNSTPTPSFYTQSHVGTYARLHQ